MDEDSLRNWGYYEPSFKGHLGLQLMSTMVDRHTKPFLSGHDNPLMVSPNGTYHPRDRVAAELPATQMDYVRDSWINHPEKFLHMFPTNSFDPVVAGTPGTHHAMPEPHPSDPTKDTELKIEEPSVKKRHVPAKKRAAPVTPKTSKSKKPRKGPVRKENDKSSVHRAKTSKKNMDVVINGVDFDISSIPIPVCSCTGTPQQCYRWGFGGWQSACCTMTISMYPLPMSTKRRGARIAGRKMSQGAFKKVLEKLASDGYDFANSIDLRTYWAKHGTNKFVTIR